MPKQIPQSRAPLLALGWGMDAGLPAQRFPRKNERLGGAQYARRRDIIAATQLRRNAHRYGQGTA
jgi:hypothetical protein